MYQHTYINRKKTTNNKKPQNNNKITIQQKGKLFGHV